MTALEWYYFEFLDKRWLVTAWSVSLLIAIISSSVFSFKYLKLTKKFNIPTFSIAKCLLAILLATILRGPPWNLSESVAPLDLHEAVQLGALQAIENGLVPYTEATTQYGPGQQLLMYKYTRLRGLSILSVREFYAWIQYLSLACYFIVAFNLLPFIAALIVVVISLKCSPFALYFFEALPQQSSYLAGWFGWANPMRGFSPVVLIMCLPHIYFNRSEPAGIRYSYILGLAIGILCWIAQENLFTGVTMFLLMLIVAWAQWGITYKYCFKVLGAYCLGIVTIALPILAPYFLIGNAGEFISYYFQMPRQVLSGYSNMNWNGSYYSLQFYTAPFLLYCGLISAFIATIFMAKSKTTESTAYPRCFLLTSVSVAGLVLYQGALLRSDWIHFLGSSLVLPLWCGVWFATFWDIPKQRSQRFLSILVAIVPYGMLFGIDGGLQNFDNIYERYKASVATSSHEASLITTARLGFGVLPQSSCCTDIDATWAELITAAKVISAKLKTASVAAIGGPGNSPGIILFLAQLNVVGQHQDPILTVNNSSMRSLHVQELLKISPDCLIDAGSPEMIQSGYEGLVEYDKVYPFSLGRDQVVFRCRKLLA